VHILDRTRSHRNQLYPYEGVVSTPASGRVLAGTGTGSAHAPRTPPDHERDGRSGVAPNRPSFFTLLVDPTGIEPVTF
jgi:hypothetical protein